MPLRLPNLSLLLRQSPAILGRALGRPWYLVLLPLLLAVLLLTLAYQVHTPIVLNVGDSYSRAYLRGFHEPERLGGIDYAHTAGPATIRLEGIGQGPALLQVWVGGGHPGVTKTLTVGGPPLVEIPAGGNFVPYTFLLPATAARGGTLELVWSGETATSLHDPRPLGVAVDRVTWKPLRGSITPAWGQV